MESNIDSFNNYTAIIFDFLYSQFPNKTEVLANDFLNETEHNEIFLNTMTFLKDEGFINFESFTIGGGKIAVFLWFV